MTTEKEGCESNTPEKVGDIYSDIELEATEIGVLYGPRIRHLFLDVKCPEKEGEKLSCEICREKHGEFFTRVCTQSLLVEQIKTKKGLEHLNSIYPKY